MDHRNDCNCHCKSWVHQTENEMKTQTLLFVWLLMLCLNVNAQFPITLKDSVYADASLPDIEPTYNYGFVHPIYANVLSANQSTYTPSASNRYFMSLFGPRYKQTSTSNIGFYDFHQGEDFSPNVTYNNLTYDTANKVSEVCMCDGIVTNILDSTDAYLETIEQGRSVTVKCDSTFKANTTWGNIYMNYRHLSKIDSALKVKGVNAVIHKGDTVGKIGMSGQTEAVHLHYSVTRSTPQGMKHVHPMRVFNPQAIPHLHNKLDTAITMQLLGAWNDSALIRLAVPYNEMCIKKIRVTCGVNYTREFDFEEIANQRGRDTNNIVPGLAMYAYPFNRYQSAYSRYKQLDSLMPVVYPAARFRPVIWGNFPILNVWPYNKPQYVLDIMVSQLPPVYNYNNLVIEIQDIYGTVVKSTSPGATLPVTMLSFDGRVVDEEVKLMWVTASEVNSDYFIVERSVNGTDFSPLRKVKASVNSNVLKDYVYFDQTADKHNYYRLQIVDKDSKYAYSKIIYVKGNKRTMGEPEIYPNPTSTHIQIDFSQSLYKVTAIDANGNRILLHTLDGKYYDVSILAEGRYILECTTQSKNYYSSVIVVR